MKKLTTLFLFLAVTNIVNAQDSTNFIKKIIKKTFSSQGDTTRKGSFFILPAFSYAQETGAEFGIAAAYNFYLDKENLESRTSNISLISTLTTKKQKKINLNADLWSKNNDYHILLELRARDWPFNFYGIGNDTWISQEDYLEQTLYRVKADIEKRIAKKIYIGINTSYDHYKFQDVIEDGIFSTDNSILGKSGGQYATIGLSALFDSRDITTYTNKGIYSRIKFAYAPHLFEETDFTGSLFEADVRGFHPIHKKIIASGQLIYRGTYGENLPFYTLRDLGGDMTMRGYYLGRYKDKNYIASQAELRYRFHPRFGIVGFAGAGTTFSDEHKARWTPSYGSGLRYFFSIEHSSSIRFDYAFGEQRTGEKRQSGFYLSLSETF
ncbi:BamA/TamA family outer membrane protein [Sphingobacterium bovistauri]|uniref:BamA/TamA family outer membrane protein n=1 Tax=Sphingobacterium bovistauri TaxID=2781959 RepID=A0ABS7Z2U0_9SPHI|nr:BamA/TamA family outer membrane protein [Sphingobacterium bovistauri]MCA5004493.1 BamA/TamA family outer membrane protein [Sphingobacterium bovistauri]